MNMNIVKMKTSVKNFCWDDKKKQLKINAFFNL